MNNNYKNHFTTGEFAKLCDVKKHTLFHYDNIGIFSPEITTDSGYRYYSFNQLEVFNVISALKELDMSLSDIKKYLDTRTPENFISLLEDKKTVIENKINELQKLQNLVSRKIQITKKALNINTDEIKIVELPKSYLVTTDSLDTSKDKNIAVSLANHINYCKEHNIYSPYAIGGMISFDSIKKELYSYYSCFYTELENGEETNHNFIKEEGLYIVAYHEGGFYTSDSTYKKIIKFIKENNLKPSSDFYEDILLDDICVNGYENYVLKISIKVELKV